MPSLFFVIFVISFFAETCFLHFIWPLCHPLSCCTSHFSCTRFLEFNVTFNRAILANKTFHARFFFYFKQIQIACAYLDSFDHVELYHFAVANTPEELPRIVFLDCRLRKKDNKSHQNKSAVTKFRSRFTWWTNTSSLVSFLRKAKQITVTPANKTEYVLKKWITYRLMKPYPLRTLNHFTVPCTKVAEAMEEFD